VFFPPGQKSKCPEKEEILIMIFFHMEEENKHDQHPHFFEFHWI